MKLFKARVAMHWTNSHSYIGGYPDVYVIAETEEQAKQKALTYKETNKRAVDVIMIEEINPVII